MLEKLIMIYILKFITIFISFKLILRERNYYTNRLTKIKYSSVYAQFDLTNNKDPTKLGSEYILEP